MNQTHQPPRGSLQTHALFRLDVYTLEYVCGYGIAAPIRSGLSSRAEAIEDSRRTSPVFFAHTTIHPLPVQPWQVFSSGAAVLMEFVFTLPLPLQTGQSWAL